MNWTEGNLARHSRRGKNAELVARQKKYFATARSGFFQPSGTRAGPPSISFLPSPKSKHASAPRASYVTSTASNSSRHGSSGHNQIPDVASLRSTRGEHRGSYSVLATAPKSNFKSAPEDKIAQYLDFAPKRPHTDEHHEADDLLYIHAKRRRLLQVGDWAGLSQNVRSRVDLGPPPPRTSPKNGWSKRASLPQPVRRPKDTLPLDSASRRRHPSTNNLQVDSETAYSIQIGSQPGRRKHQTFDQPRHSQELTQISLSDMESQVSETPSDSPSSICRRLRTLQNSERTKPSLGCPLSTTPKSRKQRASGTGEYHQEQRESSFEGPVPRITYSSSVIHGPIPRRHSTILNSGVDWSCTPITDAPSSVQVEIGGVRETITPNQLADDTKWRNWLIPSSCSQSPKSQSLPPQVCISPGVSMLSSLMAHELPTFEPLADGQIDGQTDDMLPKHRGGKYYGGKSLIDSRDGSQSPYSDEGSPDELELPPVERMKPGAFSKLNDATLTKQAKTDVDNSTWMKFLFEDDEDSSEIINHALNEATSAAAQRVSSRTQVLAAAPLATMPSDGLHKTSSAATCGTTLRRDSPIMTARSDSCDLSVSSAWQSRAMSPGIPVSSRFTEQEDQADAHASMIAECGASEDDKGPKPVFTMPSTFVGKLSTSGHGAGTGMHSSSLSCQPSKSMRRRGRPKRRALDGRPEIRNLPDFSSDPIEE